MFILNLLAAISVVFQFYKFIRPATLNCQYRLSARIVAPSALPLFRASTYPTPPAYGSLAQKFHILL